MSLRNLQLTGPRILESTSIHPAALLGIKTRAQTNFTHETFGVQYHHVKPSPGKGLGVFAKNEIPAFTRIVSDSALLAIHEGEDLPQLYENFMTLDESMRDQVLQYDYRSDHGRDANLNEKLIARGYSTEMVPRMTKLAAIFQANAFNVRDDTGIDTQRVRRVMFPTMARINHSCVPNAHCNYDAISGRMTTYTLRHVEPGEEIEISYFNLILPRADRQARAQKWGFTCACPACNEQPDLELGYEARRDRIRSIEHDLLVTLTSGASIKELNTRVNEANEMVDIILQEKALTPQLPIAYDYVAMLQAVLYEVDRNAIRRSTIVGNLASAVEAESKITGEGSQATKRRREKMMAIQNAP